MGGKSSKSENGAVWKYIESELNLNPECLEFPIRYVAIKEKTVYDHNQTHNFRGRFSPTLNHLQKFFPQSYEIIRKLYNAKVAYISSNYSYSNNLPLEDYKEGNICYKMPSEYKELDNLIQQEFDAWQAVEKEKYEAVCKEKADLLISKVKI
jgi:hypothetical protein